jgi:hypothetical protein
MRITMVMMRRGRQKRERPTTTGKRRTTTRENTGDEVRRTRETFERGRDIPVTDNQKVNVKVRHLLKLTRFLTIFRIVLG